MKQFKQIVSNKLGKVLAAAVAVVAAVALFTCLTSGPTTAQADPVLDYYNPITVVKGSGVAAAVVNGSGTWTNAIAATSSFSNYTRIGPIVGKDITVEVTAQASGANTGSLYVWLGRSVSPNGAGVGGSGSTNIEQFLTWTAGAMNGATPVLFCTNLSSANGYAGAINYLYVNTISNAGAASITNYAVKINQR